MLFGSEGTTAVGSPSLDSMRAAPRAGRHEHSIFFRWIACKERCEVLDSYIVVFCKYPECAGECHFAKPVMMSESLSVHRRSGNELLVVRIEMAGQLRAVTNQSAE